MCMEMDKSIQHNSSFFEIRCFPGTAEAKAERLRVKRCDGRRGAGENGTGATGIIKYMMHSDIQEMNKKYWNYKSV